MITHSILHRAKVLSDILEKTDKKLILQYCCSPLLTSIFYECAKKYVDKIGDQLAIIGAYHHDQPVILYLPEAFKKLNTGQTFYNHMMQSLWNPIWNKNISEDTLQALEKSCAETGYALLFKDIDHLGVEALFQSHKSKLRRD